MKSIVSLISFYLICFSLQAVTLSGRVTDFEDNPLANVVVVTTGKYHLTDDSGQFSLENLNPDDLISFYRTGYRSHSLSVREMLALETIVLEREYYQLSDTDIFSKRETLSIQTPDKIHLIIRSEMRGRDFADILQSIPEIKISGTSLLGERKTISLLGHHPRHTLIMLDGVPLNSQGQAYDISKIPTEIIESIEIIKGGDILSSGALGGIININTREPLSRYSLALTKSVGSFGLNRSSVSASHRNRYFSTAIFLDNSVAKNDFTYRNRQGIEKKRLFNDKTSQNLTFRFTNFISKNIVSSYRFELLRFNHKLPGPLNYEALYRNATLTGKSLKNSLHLFLISGQTSYDIIMYQHRNETEYNNTEAPISFYHLVSEQIDKRLGFNIKSKKELEMLTADFSFEFLRDEFEYTEPENTKNKIPNVTQDNFVFSSRLHSLYETTGLDLYNSVAYRLDYSEKWRDHHSFSYDGSVAVFYPLNLTLGGGLAENFSLPSFFDLYWKGDFQTTGNPDLTAETSRHYKLYAELSYLSLLSRIEVHRSDVDNLIYWYRSVTGWKPGNISRARIDNFSIMAEYQLPDILSLSSSYLISSAENGSLTAEGKPSDLYGKKLPYRPNRTLQTNLSLNYDRYYLRLSHRLTGKQWTTLDQLIDPLPEYQLTDVELGVNLTGFAADWRVSLTFNNIFDKRYETYHYTPEPGFNWFCNITYNLQK